LAFLGQYGGGSMLTKELADPETNEIND